MTGGAPAVRRIVVALGTSTSASFEALSTASALASRLGAQLEGLFLEDVRVLRAAGLPFITQLSLPSGERRPLERGAVEAELRAVAAAAREALGATASAHGIRWSFRVARGHVWIELQQAWRGAELMVVGLDGRRVRGGGRGERGIGQRRRTDAPRRDPGPSPVLVAYDGSAASDRAVEIAGQLAEISAPLLLVVLAGSPEEAQTVAGRAVSRHLLRRLQTSWAGGESLGDLARAIRGAVGPVVVPEPIALAVESGPELLFEAIGAPLVIVR